MCDYEKNIKAGKTRVKPGDVVKDQYGDGHYTVQENDKVYSHQTKNVLGATNHRDIERYLENGNLIMVHPATKPEPKVGPGSIVRHSDGEVYTITGDDKYFSHSENRVLENDMKASQHVKKHADFFTVLV